MKGFGFKRAFLPPLAVLALAPALFLVLAGCGGGTVSQANQLVAQAEDLRAQATDRFRNSTASVDDMVTQAAAGQSLPPNQTKTTTDSAAGDLNTALNELNQRAGLLKQAQKLQLNSTYQRYLSLLQKSNDQMTLAIKTALTVPQTIKQERYSLAGWDQIKTAALVDQMRVTQQRIEDYYSQSETLRNQAGQLRDDNPGSFG